MNRSIAKSSFGLRQLFAHGLLPLLECWMCWSNRSRRVPTPETRGHPVFNDLEAAGAIS